VQNPREVGHGYYKGDKDLKRPEGDRLTWHFEAEKVHDFMWAADTNYVHKTREMENGTTLHFLYKDEEDLVSKWTKLEDYTIQLFEFANEHYGEYPWPQYSVIQGGDGGMEYPMATLITGQRSLGSLVGVTVHEAMHSWYYGLMANNEGLYPWMDEGFTTYTSSRIMSHLFNPEEDSRTGRYYNSYFNLANSDKQEPMSTMGDHFSTNYAYGTSAYGKGAVFVAQLGYILGEEALNRGLRRYYEQWKFKHPSPNDFIRVMEKTGDIHLKWYLSYMLNTIKTIDYSITRVEASQDKTHIKMERIGEFPMPIDLNIEYRDGSEAIINIPLRIMRGSKPAESDSIDYRVAEDWPWTSKTYSLTLEKPISEIARITIDSSGRMADIERENNTIELSEDTEMIIAN
jgi:aminopeptidase N